MEALTHTLMRGYGQQRAPDSPATHYFLIHVYLCLNLNIQYKTCIIYPKISFYFFSIASFSFLKKMQLKEACHMLRLKSWNDEPRVTMGIMHLGPRKVTGPSPIMPDHCLVLLGCVAEHVAEQEERTPHRAILCWCLCCSGGKWPVAFKKQLIQESWAESSRTQIQFISGSCNFSL